MKLKACHHRAHRGPARLERALAQFKELGLRLTNPRKGILGALASASRPLSPDEIFTQVNRGQDLATVYRSLTAMEEAGMLRRYEFGDGVRRYELSSQEDEHHHHYIRCRDCGSLEAFAGCEFEGKLSRLLAQKGYQMIRHTLDVQALCRACQN